jgi:hypothetical protein
VLAQKNKKKGMMIEMKKKFIAVICVIALTLSLPMLAWGLPSPENGETFTDPESNISIAVSLGEDSDGTITSIAVAAEPAKGVPADLPATQEVLASFEVIGTITTGSVNLTFAVGTEWAGYTCTVYIEHSDGTLETQTVVVAADGTLTLSVTKLSTFTLVVDTTSAPAPGGTVTDTGSTSPKTGVDLSATTGTIAGLTIAMAIAAAFVAVALRRKVIQ